MDQIIRVPLTMSSREIAELTGKEHRNVMRDIREMLAELHGEGGMLNFEHTPEGYIQNWMNPQNGKTYREFSLPKDLTLTLVAGYSVRLRKRIIDRWLELEEAAAQPSAFALPQNYVEALKALAAEVEGRIALEYRNAALEDRIEADAPKLAALERFASHDGQLGLRSGAKVLGVREHKLKAWMLINRWYYRDHCGRLCAYADKIAAGYLDTVPVEIRRSSGIEVVPQPVITQKGLARLAELLAKDGLLPGAGP